MRLAKKIISDAKQAHHIEKDDFFLSEPQDKPFVGVYRDEENEQDLVTKTLQKELVKKEILSIFSIEPYL